MAGSIDWPLTFSGFSTFLEPLASASWPIGIFAVALLFRSEIRALVARIKKLSGAGIEAELTIEALQHSTAPGTEAPLLPAFGTEAPQPDQVYDALDREAREILEREIGGDLQKQLAWALRMRSISEAARRHEANFRIMMGSQLTALQRLNLLIRMPLEDFTSIYNEAVSNPDFAPMYERLQLDAWLNWLHSTGYIEVTGVPPSTVSLTPWGGHFMLWMTQARVIPYRPG
ncbi:hypothetical protein [Altererythrobacter fulvus]|uniref:hypothetical protein n=1 Tax=Caenibius fulvus TaxID=2126012 RepID=UPI00301816D5